MASKLFTSPLPYLALILAHLIWGANFVVAKVTLQEFPLFSLIFLKFGLAFLLLLPFFLAETKKIKIKLADLPRLVGVGIFIISLNTVFFYGGLQRTSAINASILILFIPILSVLFGWLFLKEKIFVINLVGICFGLVGALINLGLIQIILGTFTPEALVGNIMIILASITWVIGAMLSRQMLKIYPSLLVTAVAFLVGTVTLALPAAREYLADPSWPSRISSLGLLGLAYVTILSSVSAYLLFEWGLARTSLIAADLFQYLEPFVAASLAVTLLGERISFSYIVGAVLIALGVYWGTFAKEAHHRHKAHRH